MILISLAAARVNAGLTQIQAAQRIGVSKATIISWEKGYTSPASNQLKKLSKLYEMPIDYIFLPETLLKVENVDNKK